ncbi:MAG TPA: hypothetical protein VIL13_03355 [Longimicrobiales bacterium]
MTDPSLPDREGTRGLERQLATELEQVPGVLAAAVWLGDPPRVRDVYVAAAPEASLSEIQAAATDILRRHGLVFSTDAIHVGVLDESETPPPPDEPAVWRKRFLVFGGLEFHRAGSHITCRVEVFRLGEAFWGEAKELDSELGRARAAVLATLRAAEQASRGVHLGLEGVLVTHLFGHRYVVLSVEAASQRRFAHLSGIMRVEQSLEEAAALATLSAIERWIAW